MTSPFENFTFNGNYEDFLTGVSLEAASSNILIDTTAWSVPSTDDVVFLSDFINSLRVAFRNGVSLDTAAKADLEWIVAQIDNGTPAGVLVKFVKARGCDGFTNEVKRQLAEAGLDWDVAVEAAQAAVIQSTTVGGGYTAKGTWVPPVIPAPKRGVNPAGDAGYLLFVSDIQVEPDEIPMVKKLLINAVHAQMISFADYKYLSETVLGSTQASEKQKVDGIIMFIERKAAGRVTAAAPPSVTSIEKWAPQESNVTAALEAAVKGIGNQTIFTVLPQIDSFGLPAKGRLLPN